MRALRGCAALSNAEISVRKLVSIPTECHSLLTATFRLHHCKQNYYSRYDISVRNIHISSCVCGVGDIRKYGIVYTDGCCRSNGKDNPRAGVGVFWGPGDPRNVSLRLDGKQTNNRAEILAAFHAIKQAKESGITHLVVLTDSMYVKNAMTNYIMTWKRNEWKGRSGKEVANLFDWKRMDEEASGLDIAWKYVPGHSDNEGNHMADQLANEGAMKDLT